ncbi:MAG: hypothetical protein K2G92_02940, partial [Duncaniella sp.]|nr:hypothetical protein [Duncaniella sp.]
MGLTVNLSQITDFAKFSTEFSNLGAEYVFTRITSASQLPQLTNGPFRIDGTVWMLCADGSLDIEVNLNHYTMGPGSF